MLISELVAAVAEVEGIPEPTVTLAARYTREAGLLSQGARGRHAPHATARDCANILIAANAWSGPIADTPKAVKLYRKLYRSHGGFVREGDIVRAKTPRLLQFLEGEKAERFGDALEMIVQRFIDGDLETYFKAEAVRYIPPKALKDQAEKRGIAGDAGALDKLIAEMATMFLVIESVRLIVEFSRPTPFARIVIERDIDVGVTETIFHATYVLDADDFSATKGLNLNGDRKESVRIGYRTFAKIAELMRK